MFPQSHLSQARAQKITSHGLSLQENFVFFPSPTTSGHGKNPATKLPGDPGNNSPISAALRYSTPHPGQEAPIHAAGFGQREEWSEARSLDWHFIAVGFSGIQKLSRPQKHCHTEARYLRS